MRMLLLGLTASLAVAAEPLREPAVERGVEVAMGVGSGWGVGGTTAAWAPALSQRFEVAGAVGRHHVAVGFSLTHARRELVDSSVLIPDGGVPADAVSGQRDELALLFSVRVPLDVGADIPARQPVLRVLPTFGVSAGLFASDAQLQVPSYSTTVALRSRALLPTIGARVGCELRVLGWMSLLPHAELLVLVAGNRGELSGHEQFDVEGRVMLGGDVVVRF